MYRCLPTIVQPLAMLIVGTIWAAPAQLVSTRSGATPSGATRVVFETDRPVDFLTVELGVENGFEVHLLDVNGEQLPGPVTISNGNITGVTFRPTPNGVVARLTGKSIRLSAMSFPLSDPPRVVVDVREAGTPQPTPTLPLLGSAPRAKPTSLVTAGPTPSTKVRRTNPSRSSKTSSRPAVATPALALTAGETGAGRHDGGQDVEPPTTIFEQPASAVAKASKSSDEEDDLGDLLAWIHRLKASVDALNGSEVAEDRAKYRRRLAFLLYERGILVEAERALNAAVTSAGYDTLTSTADSLRLAEIRLHLRDTEGALEVARSLDTSRLEPRERVRLGRLLLNTDNPVLAQTLLEATLADLDEPHESRAKLLLGQAHWDQGNTKKSHAIARRLTSNSGTPRGTMPGALLLHADCEFALGKSGEAQTLYLRAQAHPLSNEEGSWVGLQLGNLARRAGRLSDARRHWDETSKKWPETFFGSQAAWFLRFHDEMHKLRQAEAWNDRG